MAMDYIDHQGGTRRSLKISGSHSSLGIDPLSGLVHSSHSMDGKLAGILSQSSAYSSRGLVAYPEVRPLLQVGDTSHRYPVMHFPQAEWVCGQVQCLGSLQWMPWWLPWNQLNLILRSWWGRIFRGGGSIEQERETSDDSQNTELAQEDVVFWNLLKDLADFPWALPDPPGLL